MVKEQPSGECEDNILSMATILIVGDTHQAEMKSLLQWLKGSVFPAARTVFVNDLSNLDGKFSSQPFPDLIVVFQSWSNQFSRVQVNSLLEFAPLARIVVCYGAWCESDGRNYDVWPIAVRVPVWAAANRISREWNLVCHLDQKVPLPLSASREEVFAEDHSRVSATKKTQSVMIDSPDCDYRQFLRELLMMTGYNAVETSPDIIVFDIDPWESIRQSDLTNIRSQCPQARLVCLTTLPSTSLLSDLSAYDVSCLIPKAGVRSIETDWLNEWTPFSHLSQ